MLHDGLLSFGREKFGKLEDLDRYLGLLAGPTSSLCLDHPSIKVNLHQFTIASSNSTRNEMSRIQVGIGIFNLTKAILDLAWPASTEEASSLAIICLPPCPDSIIIPELRLA